MINGGYQCISNVFKYIFEGGITIRIVFYFLINFVLYDVLVKFQSQFLNFKPSYRCMYCWGYFGIMNNMLSFNIYLIEYNCHDAMV